MGREWINTAYEYYRCVWSHSFSFARASARWERLFFLALSISAYVCPSYSNIGSQPGYREEMRQSVCTEDMGIALSYRNSVVLELERFCPGKNDRSGMAPRKLGDAQSYRHSTLKYQWLVTGSMGKGKSAHGLSTLVLIRQEHIIQPLVTQGLEKPFTVNDLSVVRK